MTDLPHIIPGQPRRSMYGEHNTHDETVALTAAAFQALADSILKDARSRIPLSRGRLRSSIQVESIGDDGTRWVRSDTYHLDRGSDFDTHGEGHVERNPIRVVAEVGKPTREIES